MASAQRSAERLGEGEVGLACSGGPARVESSVIEPSTRPRAASGTIMYDFGASRSISSR